MLPHQARVNLGAIAIRVLCIPQISIITGASPSGSLVSYLGHSLEGGLLLCRDAVGVFYSPSHLGFCTLFSLALILGIVSWCLISVLCGSDWLMRSFDKCIYFEFTLSCIIFFEIVVHILHIWKKYYIFRLFWFLCLILCQPSWVIWSQNHPCCEQQWYYLTHPWDNKRVHAFP